MGNGSGKPINGKSSRKQEERRSREFKKLQLSVNYKGKKEGIKEEGGVILKLN